MRPFNRFNNEQSFIEKSLELILFRFLFKTLNVKFEFVKKI